MSYELAFLEPALKEWRKLDAQTREQFKRKLIERLADPRVPSARLSGPKERYKIKPGRSATAWCMKSASSN